VVAENYFNYFKKEGLYVYLSTVKNYNSIGRKVGCHNLVSGHWSNSPRNRERGWGGLIDQTSIRTKGTVVVFGLTKL
jgi:hypothetical protein